MVHSGRLQVGRWELRCGPFRVALSTRTRFRRPLCGSCGPSRPDRREVIEVLEETQEREDLIERVAALDIGKAELVCCVRLAGRAGLPDVSRR
jgi:hypothetical protein